LSSLDALPLKTTLKKQNWKKSSTWACNYRVFCENRPITKRLDTQRRLLVWKDWLMISAIFPRVFANNSDYLKHTF